MADLPKELFEISDKKRKYFFINLDGKEEYVELDFGDKLTNKRCLIDGAYIVAYSGDPHTIEECPVCGKYTSSSKTSSIKSIQESLIPYNKYRINALKEEINHLEAILELAQNPDNKIKKANLENDLYNKANLSADILEKL